MKKLLFFLLVFSFKLTFAQFTTMFTDTVHNYGQMNGVCQDDSFYYVIGGINNSVLKIDKQGNIVKKRKYSYPGLYFQAYPYNSVVLENNTIVCCGQAKDTSNKVTGIVVCVDKYSLDTLWFRNYQSPDSIGAYQFSENTAIKSVPQGGYIVTGNYHNNIMGNLRSFLMKIDSVGNVEWRRVYGDVTGLFDVELTNDGGGVFLNPFGYNTINLRKTDSFGNLDWQVPINTGMTGWSDASSISLSQNNTIIGARTYMYNNNISNPLMGFNIFKVDLMTKQILWDKTYLIYNTIECISLHQAIGVETLPNGDIIISGTANRYGHDAVILKLNSNGDSLWCKSYDYHPDNWDCQLNDLILTDDGGFLGVGFFSDQNSGWTAWMFKTDANGVVGWESPTSTELVANVKVWPNPAKSFTTLEFDKPLIQSLDIKVYNTLGQMLLQRKIEKGASRIKLDLSGFAAGLYYYELQNQGQIKGSGKFVLE